MRTLIFISTFFLFLSGKLLAQQTASENKVITGTVLLNDHTPPDFKVLMHALKADWNVRLDSFSQSEKTLVLYTPGATVMLAFLDYPVPLAEIKSAAEGAWLWRSAGEEAPRHQSQVVVSAIGSPDRALDLYKLYTRVAAAVLDNSNSCGVYLSSQYLLQSKLFFLQAARNMGPNTLPVYCWIYFGMFQEKELSNAYTYGLSEFGMPDIEILHSKKPLQEIHAVLYDAASDALLKNTELKDGSVIETLEGTKITLTLSKATFWEGQTLKAEY